MNENEIEINGEIYVKKSEIKKQVNVIKIGKNQSLASSQIGKFVIVRSRNEGINAGTVVCADETGVILKDCRRIYYHKPLDNKLSWYEGVSVSGLNKESKVSGSVPSKTIIENYSMTECTEIAKKSITEFTPNAQS